MPSRRTLTAVVALTLTVPALGADAAGAQTSRSALSVSQLTVPAGRALQAGEEFRLAGRVTNRGRRSSSALVTFTLKTRRRAQTAQAVGAVTLSRVRGRSSRSFSVRAQFPRSWAAAAGGQPYVVLACVRARRAARRSCTQSQRRVFVVRPSGDAVGGAPSATPPAAGAPATGAPASPAEEPIGTPGSRSLGDRLFPEIGNGGYDVTRYDLDLDYTPSKRLLQGTATLTMVATQDLSEFSLDLYSLTTYGVTIDGTPATFAQTPNKLVVTPAEGIRNGSTIDVAISYGGQMTPYIDPDGSQEGWVPNADGAFVVNEPVGAMAWFPNNNVPTDKALYDMRVAVPATSTVFANGRLVSNTLLPGGEKRRWHWREDSPMATYLTTATNGNFVYREDLLSLPAVPHYYGLDSTYNGTQQTAMNTKLNRSPSMLTFFETELGHPYPFTSSGGVIARSGVGYALESQTKPMYATSTTSTTTTGPSVETISHEIAHQWFGNSVSPATWSDIWLNEGPAEWLSLWWDEKQDGGPTTTSFFTTTYDDPAFDWSTAPAAPPTAADIFDFDAMYLRGAMVLEALRQIMGDDDRFFAVLDTWLDEHRHGSATTADWVELFKRDSGEDVGQLDIFFDEWLYGTEKPGINPGNFDSYTP